MSDVQKKEEGAEEQSCAECGRYAMGGCDPGCRKVQVSTYELMYILGRCRSWVQRAEDRGLFKRENEVRRCCSYLWTGVKAGLMKYHGALWRGRLMQAEGRFREVLSGRVVRKLTEKGKSKKQRKWRGRK
jgi:hypothetical protein